MSETGVILLFIPSLFCVMLLTLEMGRRIGKRHQDDETDHHRGNRILVESAIYGLLGLLIAFTVFGINTESTYQWDSRQWSVPVNMTVTQLLKVGGQPLTVQGGVRYWADSPDNAGPHGWGFRFAVNFLFPK